MNKFKKMIAVSASNEILQKRGDIIANKAAREQKKLIDSIKDDIDNINLELTQLTDLSPKTTVDLDPGADFDPKKWVFRVQTLKNSLRVEELKLKDAIDTYNEFFIEDSDDIKTGK